MPPRSSCSPSLNTGEHVLILPGGPSVRELFAVGATRVSTGSALAAVAQDALVQAARELQGPGTHEFWSRALRSMRDVNAAFRGKPD